MHCWGITIMLVDDCNLGGRHHEIRNGGRSRKQTGKLCVIRSGVSAVHGIDSGAGSLDHRDRWARWKHNGVETRIQSRLSPQHAPNAILKTNDV
eukprot:m.152973 g.152973  ORF g.152973 m.152973 type:complete len:94 (+) comp17903_c0_seq1:1075-1356(+)